MVEDASLLDHLRNALPSGVNLRVYHISTPPTPTSALFSAPPSQLKEEKTFRESHFLSVALPVNVTSGDEILVFAIEVLIFTTKSLTTIFVSKADSSGFLDLLKRPKGSESVIRLLATAFLLFLVQERRTGPRVVLSLFARSQNQYLFPGSIENDGKHVLDDRQLIKWWCRCLDPLLRNDQVADTLSTPSTQAKAYLIVPGCDKGETRAFFPATARGKSPHSSKWISSYPVGLLAEVSSAPPRCLIPRLPDDPKARFLDDLDGEHIGEQGQWRSVESVDRFWELMSYRQECAAGRLVGFVWVIFPVKDDGLQINGNDMKPPNDIQEDLGEPTLPTPSHSQLEIMPNSISLPAEESNVDLVPLPNSPPASSPPPQLVELEDQLLPPTPAKEDSYYDENHEAPVRWPIAGRGEMILDSTKYDLLMEYLLELDFATSPVAMQSTKSWISKAAILSEVSDWGRPLVGTAMVTLSETIKISTDAPQTVNILTGMRKKRKAEVVETSPQKSHPATLSAPGVNLLATTLIRKKPKT